MPGVNILCVANDSAFSERSLVALNRAGYVVTQADCTEEAECDFTKNSYQVTVIGPGLLRAAKERLAIKAWESGCAVVVVCSENDDYKLMADVHLASKESMMKLVATVGEALAAKYYAVAV